MVNKAEQAQQADEQREPTHAEMAVFLMSHLSSQAEQIKHLLELLVVAHTEQIQEHMPEEHDLARIATALGNEHALPDELTEIAD